MKMNTIYSALALAATSLSLGVFSQAKEEKSLPAKIDDPGFVSIFNGKDLSGWKVNGENPGSIVAKDGMIVIDGKRTHAFYNGKVGNHDFKNFEFKAKVKTFANANSGIYFHTKFQDSGWPDAGYECQVNNTHKDWRKTGSLYAVMDNKEEVAKDEEWFDYYIKVVGRHVVIKINGKVISDYTEPDNPEHLGKMPGRKIGSGTIALQAHDPESVVHYKDLKLKILPDSK
ncbi:MAG: 3-keto-disaccharide hydrolase [Verrucomicrobiales bacterium]